MMWLMMLFLLIGGAMVQTVVPSSALIGGAKLPVLLAVVLYYALSRDAAVTLLAAFLAGFLQDVLSQIPLGHSIFCFCVAGWLAGYFRHMVQTDAVVTSILFGGISNLLVTFFFYLMLVQNQLVSCSAGWVALKLFGALLLGMACTPVVFLVAGWLEKTVGTIEMEQSLDGVE